MSTRTISAFPTRPLAEALAVCLVLAAPAFAKHKEKSAGAGERLTADLHGSVTAHDGQRLRLLTDLGSIVIHTQNSGKVDYRVHLETDASQKDARLLLSRFAVSSTGVPEGVLLHGKAASRQCSGRLWVTFEVNVPRNYSLDVSTGGGNIHVADITGRVNLQTAGGNIAIENIAGAAHLQTAGGHISAKRVSGELVATTGGGHITTGEVGGGATLHTGGGHIRVASISGPARLETGGGNITLEHSGPELVADTGGGQIEVGDAAGVVRAKTGGGGIRVLRVSGPTNLETGGGSIYLTQVDSAVRATTGAGGITAWFSSGAKLPQNCEFQSGVGDIVVYLPPRLPVTIDAQVQLGEEHRVIVDPAFPLTVSYDRSGGSRVVRAEGALNGGGEVLRLRTVAGNIQLMLSDASKQMKIYRQQMDQLEEQLRRQMRTFEQQQQPPPRSENEP